MGCPRSTTLAAALLYLAYYLRCCVKDLAVRSPAVGALAANRMPAYLYRSNNDTKLLAHLARAATAGADEPAFLGPACAAGPQSFNALVKARMARDRRPVLAALTDKHLVKRWAELRGVRTCVESTSVSGTRGTGIATPSSRHRVDGVEDDAMIQHERAVKI